MKIELTRKKRALLGAVLLASLALLAVCFIGFDAGALKERIATEVWENKARKLEINGAIHLKILPRLAVAMNDVHLSGANGEGEFLQIGELQGALEILPLLQGRFAVKRIEIRDFALFAKRNPDGSTNFDDLFAKEEEADAKSLDFAIGKLALLEGRISWHDLVSEQSFLLKDVYLLFDTLGMKAEGGLQMGGKSALLEGMEFKLDSRYLVDGTTKTIRLDMPRLALTGHGEEKPLLNWKAGQVVADWGALALTIADLKLEGNYPDQLVAALELDEFNWQQKNGSVRGCSLQLSWVAKEPAKDAPNFSLEAKLGALAGEGGNWQGDPLEATFTGKWQDSDFAGKLVLPFVIQMQEDGGARLRVDNLLLEAKAAGGRLKKVLDTRLQGNFAVQLPEGASSGKGELQEADSRLDLEWQTTMPLRITFKASLNKLDVDRYWLMEAKDEEKAGERDEAPSSGFAFPIELDGVLRIGELLVNGIRVENLESRIVFANGELALTAPSGEGAEQAGQKALSSQKGN